MKVIINRKTGEIRIANYALYRVNEFRDIIHIRHDSTKFFIYGKYMNLKSWEIIGDF